MTADEALARLRESRDGEPAIIWHDDGLTVAELAHTAGVRVEYVHVDLQTWKTERRTVEAKGQEVTTP